MHFGLLLATHTLAPNPRLTLHLWRALAFVCAPHGYFHAPCACLAGTLHWPDHLTYANAFSNILFHPHSFANTSLDSFGNTHSISFSVRSMSLRFIPTYALLHSLLLFGSVYIYFLARVAYASDPCRWRRWRWI